MKKYFILVLVLFLTSCQEDDPRHPIEGTWDDKDSDSYLIFDSNTLLAYADYYNEIDGPECRLEADWVEVLCSIIDDDEFFNEGSCLMFSNPTLEFPSADDDEDCNLWYEYYRIDPSGEVFYTVSSDSLYLSYPFYMSLSRR